MIFAVPAFADGAEMRRGFQNRLRAHGEVAEMISRFSHRYAMNRPSKRATEHGADVLHAGIGERTERDHDGQREFLDQREDFLVGPVDRHHVVDLQNEAVQRDLHPVVVVLETLHLHQHRVPRVRPALQRNAQRRGHERHNDRKRLRRCGVGRDRGKRVFVRGGQHHHLRLFLLE